MADLAQRFRQTGEVNTRECQVFPRVSVSDERHAQQLGRWSGGLKHLGSWVGMGVGVICVGRLFMRHAGCCDIWLV